MASLRHSLLKVSALSLLCVSFSSCLGLDEIKSDVAALQAQNAELKKRIGALEKQLSESTDKADNKNFQETMVQATQALRASILKLETTVADLQKSAGERKAKTSPKGSRRN